MTDWQLGIDYGTTYTVAAIAQGNNVTVIDVESTGRSRMPSSVFLNPDGKVLVGTGAQHQASFAPERFEATPKRMFGEGELFLGDRLVEVVDLASAVIRRVYAEASLQQGETAPSAVRITHPAVWADVRLRQLREAVERAGISEYELIPEPVAAAARIGLLATSPGDIVAVYDFGGGTFDAAVLRRTDDGFEIAGRPTGRDPLGGEEIDQRLIEHLASVLSAGFEDQWKSLLNPPDSGWRRRAMELRAEVQRAKETLSEATVCQLWIPGLERDAQLTRDELNELVRPDVDATVDTLQAALDAAHVTVEELSGIYLVGGSSRIPLVADTILARTGRTPTVQENPKSVVAMGAAGWDLLRSATRTAAAPAITVTSPETEAAIDPGLAAAPVATDSPPPVPGVGVDGTYTPRLVMAVGVDAWPDGSNCLAEIEIDRVAPPALTVRVREEPARAESTAYQAQEAGQARAARTPGFAEQGSWWVPVLGEQGVERRFDMTSGGARLSMLERYVTVGERAWTMASPEEARSIADSVTLVPQVSAAGTYFECRLAAGVPKGWTVTERVTLRRNGPGHTVQAICTTLPAHIGAEEWRRRLYEEILADRPGATVTSNVAGPVLNRFQGEIATVLWARAGVPMITRRGFAVSYGFGYVVTITLKRDEVSTFSSLARQARVGAAAV